MRVSLLFLLIVCFTCAVGQSINVPPPIGYVSDFEDLFTPAQEDSLLSVIESHEKKTTNEIVIVTIPAKLIMDADINDYTLTLLRTWGVGKKSKNNGVLIGICTSRRTIRIQNGYGIEKVLSDKETNKIIEQVFLPSFKQAKFFEGTYKGLIAIIGKLPS